MIYSPEKWTLTKHKPRPVQIEIINEILSAIDQGYKNIILEAGTGIGKALALDTKIPTPTGFTTMADLKVGDEVFDEKGNICHVITKSEVFENHDCYEISFVQGGKVIADANHQWTVQTAQDRKRKRESYSTLTTEEMAKKVFVNHDSRKNYSVDVCNPIQLEDIELPINPYILGIWLGDGSSYKPEIITNDEEVLSEFSKEGFTVVKYDRDYVYGIRVGFLKLLEENNLLGNKHIPEIYLRASYKQRLALIQGLMDSDGHIGKDGGCEITLKNESMIYGLKELLCSMGIKTNVREVYKRAANTNQPLTLYYELTFTTNLPVFRLQRHLDRLPNYVRSTQYRRYIESIEKVESVPTQCICVDSSSHLFLCTENFIPTHNSAIATTISNYFNNSYIVTMTNQLLHQYLHDFHYMVKQIKGKDNYPCRFTEEIGKCEVEKINEKLLEEYNEQLAKHKQNPETYPRPKKPELEKSCKEKCPFIIALQEALQCPNIITNYDFLYYAGNYAKILPERELIIFDESHNFESKIMNLTITSLNRKTTYKKYGFDIFEGLTQKRIGNKKPMTLDSLKQDYNYWITIYKKLIDIENTNLSEYINQATDEYFKNQPHVTDEDIRRFENELIKNDKGVKKYRNTIKRYEQIISFLETGDWVIELPTKKDIINDTTYLTNEKIEGLKAEFKPLTVNEYTDSLLHFGETRLFMTGTLGSKNMFCQWIGIDPEETYHIYKKSPFPVEHRPIYRYYSGDMSHGNWRNEDHLLVLHDILEEYKNEKGVIHVSSNEQAWWIRNELKDIAYRALRVASGRKREEVIQEFEDNEKNMVLISPSVKDGVDFKGDKCRFQIIYKCPFPMLKGEQINRRRYRDEKWYIYQTVMPLMQAYGRGVRDMDDYCTTYVLDSSFEGLLTDHTDLFNEYFLEAVDGFDWEAALKECMSKGNPVRRSRKVKRVPRMEVK